MGYGVGSDDLESLTYVLMQFSIVLNYTRTLRFDGLLFGQALP